MAEPLRRMIDVDINALQHITISAYRDKRVVKGTKKRVTARFLIEQSGFRSRMFTTRREAISTAFHSLTFKADEYVRILFFYAGKDEHTSDEVPIETREFLAMATNYSDMCRYLAGLMKRLD